MNLFFRIWADKYCEGEIRLWNLWIFFYLLTDITGIYNPQIWDVVVGPSWNLGFVLINAEILGFGLILCYHI